MMIRESEMIFKETVITLKWGEQYNTKTFYVEAGDILLLEISGNRKFNHLLLTEDQYNDKSDCGNDHVRFGILTSAEIRVDIAMRAHINQYYILVIQPDISLKRKNTVNIKMSLEKIKRGQIVE